MGQPSVWILARMIWYHTILQIPIKRSLDLFRLMWWLFYVGYRYDMWLLSHLLGSDVSPNLWEDPEDPGGACLSPSYTSNMRFSKSRLLAISWLPWPMTQLTFGGNLKTDKKLLKFNSAKIASNLSLQLSSPNLYTCSTVTFRTMLWETTLLLHLLSLITKNWSKKKMCGNLH